MTKTIFVLTAAALTLALPAIASGQCGGYRFIGGGGVSSFGGSSSGFSTVSGFSGYQGGVRTVLVGSGTRSVVGSSGTILRSGSTVSSRSRDVVIIPRGRTRFAISSGSGAVAARSGTASRAAVRSAGMVTREEVQQIVNQTVANAFAELTREIREMQQGRGTSPDIEPPPSPGADSESEPEAEPAPDESGRRMRSDTLPVASGGSNLDILRRICFDCHSGDFPDGKVALDGSFDEHTMLRAVQAILQRKMPPPGGMTRNERQQAVRAILSIVPRT